VLHRRLSTKDDQAIPLFAGCSRAQLQLASRLTTPLTLPAGKILAHQGARPSQFVIVVNGIAEARRDDRPIEVIGPGQYFGEISLVRSIREPATVIARTDITIDIIAKHDFRTLYSLLDTFRHHVDHELDQRVASWITPRPTHAATATLVTTR
jgi:CRP-like cAMP-binding protein